MVATLGLLVAVAEVVVVFLVGRPRWRDFKFRKVAAETRGVAVGRWLFGLTNWDTPDFLEGEKTTGCTKRFAFDTLCAGACTVCGDVVVLEE